MKNSTSSPNKRKTANSIRSRSREMPIRQGPNNVIGLWQIKGQWPCDRAQRQCIKSQDSMTVTMSASSQNVVASTPHPTLSDKPTPVGGNGSQDFWCVVTVTYRDHTMPIDSPHFITNAYSLRDTSRGCSTFTNSKLIMIYLYNEYTIIFQRINKLYMPFDFLNFAGTFILAIIGLPQPSPSSLGDFTKVSKLSCISDGLAEL